jgi:hypothetical protein
MKFRVITASAVLVAWLCIYLLGLIQNPIITFLPMGVLAFFQIGEKRYLRNLNGKK